MRDGSRNASMSPKQRLFALRADDEVDERRAEHGVGVLRREVAAPDDWHMRQAGAHLRQTVDGLRQLRAGHHGDAEQRDPRVAHPVGRESSAR